MSPQILALGPEMSPAIRVCLFGSLKHQPSSPEIPSSGAVLCVRACVRV
jgi:hypothetical protein